MRVDKVVLRAALSTLAAIAALLAFMILALCLIYPSAMMKITYELGMDSSSIRNATRAYERTDDVEMIAYATEVAIGADDYEKINECGELLIADDEFAAYCQKRNAELGKSGYEQYIYGQVCVAKYRQGDATAIDRAFALVGNAFPENNAIAAVLFAAMNANDSASVLTIKEKMSELSVSAADGVYYGAITYALENWLNG